MNQWRLLSLKSNAHDGIAFGASTCAPSLQGAELNAVHASRTRADDRIVRAGVAKQGCRFAGHGRVQQGHSAYGMEGNAKCEGLPLRRRDAGEEKQHENRKCTRSVPDLGYSSGCRVASRAYNQELNLRAFKRRRGSNPPLEKVVRTLPMKG